MSAFFLEVNQEFSLWYYASQYMYSVYEEYVY